MVRGAVGPFGEVVVERRALFRPQDDGTAVARLGGDGFPEAVFRGKRRSGRPSLSGAGLAVAGREAGLTSGARGLRRGGRALRIGYDGRKYVYSCEGLGKAKVLCRDGVRIAVETGQFVPDAGSVRSGCAVGAVDAVDLAIALVLEEADTDSLTLAGAVLSAPFALLHHFSDRAE